MLPRLRFASALATTVLTAVPAYGQVAVAPITAAPVVGQPLSPWRRGTLDLHQISTGRGNAALWILPDGTTVLMDAGAAGDGVPETDPWPDASRSPGEWIARYVRRRLPAGSTGLDYAVITHFHPDHFGQVSAGSPTSVTDGFKLSGITEVGDRIPIGTLIDRGWPSYDYPAALSDSTLANYRRFLDARRKRGMVVERARPGSHTQIRLRHEPGSFPDVDVRTIIANGEAWSGHGDSTRALFPPIASLAPPDWPNENMCSIGLRLTFGRFTYFTGGDLPGTADPGFPAWHAIEPAIADVIGRVDVHVVNQHGSMGEESEPFLRTLASTVLIVPGWAPSHPAPDVLKRIMNSRLAPTERFVFATELREAARTVIGQRASNLAGPPGHVVVRVDAGGTRYWVATVGNRDERDIVMAVKGPFATK